MDAIKLVESFKNQVKTWGMEAKDGRPWFGYKWITVKQINYLFALVYKESKKYSKNWENWIFYVDNYAAIISKAAPNGCRQIVFYNLNHSACPPHLKPFK